MECPEEIYADTDRERTTYPPYHKTGQMLNLLSSQVWHPSTVIRGFWAQFKTETMQTNIFVCLFLFFYWLSFSREAEMNIACIRLAWCSSEEYACLTSGVGSQP